MSRLGVGWRGGEGAHEEFLAHTTVLERETSLNMRDCFSWSSYFN